MGKTIYCVGALTLSDKGSRGERDDESGRLPGEMIAPIGSIVRCQIVPDDYAQIVMLLTCWSDDLQLDLILTTGVAACAGKTQG